MRCLNNNQTLVIGNRAINKTWFVPRDKVEKMDDACCVSCERKHKMADSFCLTHMSPAERRKAVQAACLFCLKKAYVARHCEAGEKCGIEE